MLLAVSLLAISLSYLIYHHPPQTWAIWARSEGTQSGKKLEGGAADQHRAESPEDEISKSGIPKVVSSGAPSPETTPKAQPSVPEDAVAIPTFTLAEPSSRTGTAGHEDDEEDEDEEDDMPPPSFPALSSAQRASGPSRPLIAPPTQVQNMGPPPTRPASSLMPPPQLKASNLRSLPTPAPVQALRVPTTGPLPNRGPVPARTPGAGLGPPSAVTTPNARGKVLLSPGHSPLDWANLQRSGQNLSGVSSLLRVTPSMLKHNNGRKGKPAWSSYQGKVYNITPYLPFHPGGEGELRRAAGKDGGKLFMEVHPWVNWENMLGECLVGIAVSEEQEQKLASLQSGGTLEDMD